MKSVVLKVNVPMRLKVLASLKLYIEVCSNFMEIINGKYEHEYSANEESLLYNGGQVGKLKDVSLLNSFWYQI